MAPTGSMWDLNTLEKIAISALLPLGIMFVAVGRFEGDPDALFKVIRAMQEAVFAAGGERVGTVIKMDDRRDREGVTMADKIASVREKLTIPQ